MQIMSKPGCPPASGRARPCGQNRAGGFTLIELMIVVAVIAILAAIAIPSYAAYIQRARRTDATRALTEAAAALERYFSQNQTYAGAALNDPNPAKNVYPAISPEGYYKLTLEGASPAAYTLTAAPTGPQTNDQCGSFTLTSTSERTVSGSLAARDCWKLN